MSKQSATIVTFYSYKGGVGRSMAVANVAWVLAEKFHKRVLLMDWDLEAPGLHRFLNVQDKEISKGLIELFNDYKTLLREEQRKLPEQLVDVRRYIQSARSFSSGGEISILPAGKQDKNYAALINEFSWSDFYANWHGFGFIEYLKKEIRKLPNIDIVIVDSRTGVTDIGGICTLQLPDIVVLLFALNDQNINGVKLVAEKISAKAVEIEGRDQPPALIIRPARVERTGNQEEKIKWQGIAATVLGDYVNDDEPQVLMAKRNIPYIGDYSYGETPLAVAKDPLGDMAEAFEDLAQSILKTARGENTSYERTSVLGPVGRLSRSVRSLWTARNALIASLVVVYGSMVVFLNMYRDQAESLEAQLRQVRASQTPGTQPSPSPTPTTQTPTAPATLTPTSNSQPAPAGWTTTMPDEAWCYQLHRAPGTKPYYVDCHRSESLCENAKSQKRGVIAATQCEFVKGLNSTGQKLQYYGISWHLYADQPFGPPFPQLR